MQDAVSPQPDDAAAVAPGAPDPSIYREGGLASWKELAARPPKQTGARHVAGVLIGWCAAAAVLHASWDAWRWPLALLQSLLLTDAIGCCVHWMFDNYWSPSTPVMGALAVSFREHHIHPPAMLKDPFWRHNWEAGLLGAAISAGLAASGRPPSMLLGFTVLFAGIQNTVHAWTHSVRPPHLVRWLQRAGMLQSAKTHALHHRHEGTHYALFNGWSEALGLWCEPTQPEARCCGSPPYPSSRMCNSHLPRANPSACTRTGTCSRWSRLRGTCSPTGHRSSRTSGSTPRSSRACGSAWR